MVAERRGRRTTSGISAFPARIDCSRSRGRCCTASCRGCRPRASVGRGGRRGSDGERGGCHGCGERAADGPPREPRLLLREAQSTAASSSNDAMASRRGQAKIVVRAIDTCQVRAPVARVHAAGLKHVRLVAQDGGGCRSKGVLTNTVTEVRKLVIFGHIRVNRVTGQGVLQQKPCRDRERVRRASEARKLGGQGV